MVLAKTRRRVRPPSGSNGSRSTFRVRRSVPSRRPIWRLTRPSSRRRCTVTASTYSWATVTAAWSSPRSHPGFLTSSASSTSPPWCRSRVKTPPRRPRTIRVPTKLDEAIEVDGDYFRLNNHLASAALYNDCPSAIASWAVDKLSTQTIASFRAKRTSPDTGVDSLYIRCTLDRAIDPLLQEHMADRCDVVFDLASDHSPFFSQPSNLCEAILS